MKKINYSYFLLIVSVILLIISCWYPICSIISTLVAIIVAVIEISKSSKLERKLDSYDEAFHVERNQQGEIENGLKIDCGTYLA
jgi:hypothetical protein